MDVVLHCPKDTYTPLTYPFISHREAAEEVWQVQITGEARPKPERAGASRTAEPLTFADGPQPDGTANRAVQHQDGAGDFNVKGVSVLTRMLTTIEHLSLPACRLKQI